MRAHGFREDLPVDQPTTSRNPISGPRIRAGVILGVAAVGGIAVGVLAASGSGPFSSLRVHAVVAKAPIHVVAAASQLFPSPTPLIVHQVITVMDPPAAAPAAHTQASAPEPVEHDNEGAPRPQPTQQPTQPPQQPRPTPRPSPDPTPSSQPSPTPGDN